MVEFDDNGSYSPVVMDFGLARESSEGQGLTESGAVLGTPAYMSPEQARGDTRHIDRRADVYSLGATLYDLLAGGPPFQDATVVGLLMKVTSDDAQPLRQRAPHIPLALETIAMKCLAKEPGQRYDTALALAEDLQRFLNSESILGQRASLRYRVRRRILRNRALWAVSGLSLVAILVLGAFGTMQLVQKQRTQKQAARRAALERQLGQDIKEIEWLLRVAYELPLHDTTHEQELVREQMAGIKKRMDVDSGPVHQALGQGFLALHENEAAILELLTAKQSGYEPAELHYALGRARGALFQQRLQEARRTGERTWVEKRRKELEAELLIPALQSLDRSRGIKLQAPEYLEGLIALFRNNTDEALQKAEAALKKVPWLYEAEELAGDAHAARGLAAKSSGQADVAKASLEAALKHYEAAANIGRSDGRLYEKAAEVLLRISEIDRELGKPIEPILERARALSDSAIIAAPQRASGYTKKAYALFFLTCACVGTEHDPSELVKQLVHVGDQAIAFDPHDGYAYDAVADGLGCMGTYEQSKGKNPLPFWQDAMDRLKHAIDVMPRFPWAYNDYGLVFVNSLAERAKHEELSLTDVRAAELSIIKATDLDPDFVYPLGNLARLYAVLSSYQLNRGQNVKESVERVKDYSSQALARDPTLTQTYFDMASSYLNQAEYKLMVGEDPRESLQNAEETIKTAIQHNNNFSDYYAASALHSMLQGEWLLNLRQDPRNIIMEGQAAARRCRELDAGNPDCYLVEAQLLGILADFLHQQGRAVAPVLAEAFTKLAQAAAGNPHYFDVYVQRAELKLRRSRGRDLDEALMDIEQALAEQPNSVKGLMLRGRLHLARAQLLQGVQQQTAARLAQSAFAEAMKLNRLLGRKYAAELAQVQKLLGHTP